MKKIGFGRGKGAFALSLWLLLAGLLLPASLAGGAAPPDKPLTPAKEAVITASWNPRNLQTHWNKHRREFPEFKTAGEYGGAALRFFADPPNGTLRKFRKNGDRLYYHEKSNCFGVTTKDGTPKTFFRPDRGIRYWNRQ